MVLAALYAVITKLVSALIFHTQWTRYGLALWFVSQLDISLQYFSVPVLCAASVPSSHLLRCIHWAPSFVFSPCLCGFYWLCWFHWLCVDSINLVDSIDFTNPIEVWEATLLELPSFHCVTLFYFFNHQNLKLFKQLPLRMILWKDSPRLDHSSRPSLGVPSGHLSEYGDLPMPWTLGQNPPVTLHPRRLLHPLDYGQRVHSMIRVQIITWV